MTEAHGLTGEQAVALDEIRRNLKRLGWFLFWDVDAQAYAAEKHGLILGPNRDPFALQAECLAANPPRPPKVRKPKQKGVLGRRPRLDMQDALWRCELDDARRVPCLALVWRRQTQMRDHLACYHFSDAKVASMSDDAVTACFCAPADVPDDGTGD